MKKLGKLKCENFPQICIEDQKSMLGGSGWSFMEGPDGNMYYYPGEAYVYGSISGVFTNLSNLGDAQESWENYASGLRTGHYFTTALGLLAGSPVATGCGLTLKILSDITYDKAEDLEQAIYKLEVMGYSDTSTFRYSRSNGVIKIWDGESGQLLYSSDGN